MGGFRPDWEDASGAVAGAPARLRAVSRSAAARPRWRVLYATLAVVAVPGAAGRTLAQPPGLVRLADGACMLALFGVIVAWMHVNRTALTRLGEPDAGIGRPTLRIIRSRRVEHAEMPPVVARRGPARSAPTAPPPL